MQNTPAEKTLTPDFIAFAGMVRIARGCLREVAQRVKELVDREPLTSVLIFDCSTSEIAEIDLRGSLDDVLARLPALEEAPSCPDIQEVSHGPGRPRLGVVAREVTLLPRHWEWLNKQSGGASVALRKLVDDARRANARKDRIRESQEACYRFMTVMAGDLAGFEEAARSLFAGDRSRFERMIAHWPEDIRSHVAQLALSAFASAEEVTT